jgi:acyl carrier protein
MKPAESDPRGAVERIVLKVFQSTLDMDEPALDASFVALGGSSLLAVRAAARLRRELGVDIPHDVIFHHQTIHELTTYLCATALDTGPGQMPAPAAPGMMAAPAVSSYFAERAGPEAWRRMPMPVWAAHDLRGPVDAERLQEAFQELTRRHDGLRTGFSHVDGRLTSIVNATVRARPTIITDLVTAGEAEADAFIKARIMEPFDRRVPPLLDVAVIARPDRDILLVTADHNVCDGWALNQIIAELDLLYREGPSAQPARVLQMSQWVAYQHERIRAIGPQAAQYWSAVLDAVPVWRGSWCGANPAGDGRWMHEFTLDAGARARLMAAAAALDVTLYSLLAGVLLDVVHAHTASAVMGFSTHSLNRGAPGAMEVVASCTSELPIVVDLTARSGHAAAAAAVHSGLLDAIRYEMVPPKALPGSIWPAEADTAEPALYFLLHDDSRPATFGAGSTSRPITQPPVAHHGIAFVATDSGHDIKNAVTWREDVASRERGLDLAVGIEAALRRI